MSTDIIDIWINIPSPNLQSVLHIGRWLTPCPHTSQMLLLIQLWRDRPQRAQNAPTSVESSATEPQGMMA